MDRRAFLKVVGAAVVAAGVGHEVYAAGAAARKPFDGAQDRPNILLIMADDLNTALSGYGHRQCKTPNLDRLAKQGVSFTRAYCQFPLCGPSRASLMSGRYPLSNGVQNNGSKLGKDVVTLPQLFRQNGYWTGRVSKIYHMGVPGHIFTGDNGSDHELSWVERYNVSAMETLSPGKAEDLMLADTTGTYEKYRKKWYAQQNQGGRFFMPEGNHQGSDFVVVEADGGDEAMADGMAATKGVELLRQRAKKKDPFFLAVGFVRPHVPLVAPRDSFKDYTADEMQLAESIEGDLDDIPDAAGNQTNERKYKMGAEQQKKVLRGYYASISYMDQQVGRLLDELDRLQLRDNTIVVFSSDHGYHLGEHTMWQKMSLMEESIRVPFIVSSPKQKSRGTCCNRIVELIDLFPTLAELAGLKPPDAIQGESFSALLDDPEGPDSRDDALIQVGKAFALRTKKWAYMRYPDKKTKNVVAMLYNMESDPKQYTNLSGKPEAAKIEMELQLRLKARIAGAQLK